MTTSNHPKNQQPHGLGQPVQITRQPHSADTLLCLVYRTGKGCKQYPFHNLTDLETWTARKPYRDEILNVIVFEDRKELRRIQVIGHLAPWAVNSVLSKEAF